MEEQEQAEESLLPKSRINLMKEARMKHKRTCKLEDLVAEDVEFCRFLGYLSLNNATGSSSESCSVHEVRNSTQLWTTAGVSMASGRAYQTYRHTLSEATQNTHLQNSFLNASVAGQKHG